MRLGQFVRPFLTGRDVAADGPEHQRLELVLRGANRGRDLVKQIRAGADFIEYYRLEPDVPDVALVRSMHAEPLSRRVTFAAAAHWPMRPSVIRSDGAVAWARPRAEAGMMWGAASQDAAAAMPDDRVLATNRTTAQDYFSTGLGPIFFEVVLPGGK